VWGPTGLVAVIDDAGGAEAERFVAGNHQGSTTLVLDAQGRSLARYAYTPEGRVEHAGGAPLRGEPLVPYLFQGQEYDHVTGLHNFRARLYDSDSGRFLAPDPLLLPGRPAYLAMNGDAVNFVDPDGRMWCHVSDLAQSTRGHMAGLMSACAVEVIMVAVYLEVPLATAAFGVAAGVVGGALAIGYGGYLAYNLATSPGSRTQTASSIGAVIFFDQFAQGQNSFEERAWNFSYGAGVAFVQVAGGKTAVAFGTAWPARLGTPSTHVGRTYVLGYLSNTLATQPVNGAILALQEAFHRRPNAAVDPAEQLGWMGLNDAVGNACYWACLYHRHVMKFAQGNPEYRAKGCMRYYIACKGFGRTTQSVALSPHGDDWNKRISDAFPDVFFGAMTDYTVLTQMAAKVRVQDVQTFLFRPGIAPPDEVASPVDADLVSPLPGGAFFGVAPVARPYDPGVEVKDFKLR
jgi:RHS repeat-associated protein